MIKNYEKLKNDIYKIVMRPPINRMSLYDYNEILRVFNNLSKNKSVETINATAFDFYEKYNCIDIAPVGIGWRIALKGF